MTQCVRVCKQEQECCGRDGLPWRQSSATYIVMDGVRTGGRRTEATQRCGGSVVNAAISAG